MHLILIHNIFSNIYDEDYLKLLYNILYQISVLLSLIKYISMLQIVYANNDNSQTSLALSG